jgi:hypothetical protein
MISKFPRTGLHNEKAQKCHVADSKLLLPRNYINLNVGSGLSLTHLHIAMLLACRLVGLPLSLLTGRGGAILNLVGVTTPTKKRKIVIRAKFPP